MVPTVKNITPEIQQFMAKNNSVLFSMADELNLQQERFIQAGAQYIRMNEIIKEIHFTMKNMKEVKANLGVPVVRPALCISPLATNPATAG